MSAVLDFPREPNLALVMSLLTPLYPAALTHLLPSSLPSHPAWEMFPRASTPPPNCPGQYRSVIEDAKGERFLGCWGQKTD